MQPTANDLKQYDVDGPDAVRSPFCEIRFRSREAPSSARAAPSAAS